MMLKFMLFNLQNKNVLQLLFNLDLNLNFDTKNQINMKTAIYYFQQDDKANTAHRPINESANWRLVGCCGTHVPVETILHLLRYQRRTHDEREEESFIDIDYEEVP